MKTEAARVGQWADLTDCDKEPIHIPGAVQPHGVLLVLREPALVIAQASENAERLLGAPAPSLLGTDFGALLSGAQAAEELRARLSRERLQDENPLKLSLHVGGRERVFNGIAHRHKGKLLLELEPSSEERQVPAFGFYHQARGSMSRLRDAPDLSGLCWAAVREVRRITGFDRVLIYRFDAEWNGAVLAEDRDEAKAAPYLGLCFPASDIPAQARALYLANGLRIIPNVDYTPARILSLPDDAAGGPLDLSFSVLRSVSPVHLEYLRNMGAQASMSISLVKDGQLWGLISCSHLSGPLYVPYGARTACEFIAEFMSSLIPTKEGQQDYGQRLRIQAVQARLLERMTRGPDFVAGLTQGPQELLELTGATGAAVHFNGQTTIVGAAPEDAQVQALMRWLAERQEQEVFVTDCLSRDFPEAEAFKEEAAGLIAASMSRGRNNWVLWFRPEVVQTVNWGGDPTKPVEQTDGGPRLHPRKSFALWRETVRGKSLSWKDYEVEAAAGLRKAIIDLVLQRSEELLKLNTELERSNVELDSFAYAASHDLKEPLRGIHNYTALALREAGSLLPEGTKDRLETVVRLTQRMERLINSLLHYSQVGRTELSLRETDLNELLGQVLESLKSRLDEAQVEIRVPRPLPSARCDRVRMSEVFANLVTNAVKYNDKEKKWVEIGYTAGPDGRAVFYVRDNGIGISPEFHEDIFRIFKRLHGRDKFGGGTGTGLTIIKRIIERHSGRVWLESTPGVGTTFFFTLDDTRANGGAEA